MVKSIDTDALKRTHPIAEIVARYGVLLRPSGETLVGRCPFHTDGGRPNLHVYPGSCSWFCYRCAIGGDVISFVERIEGVSFRQAVQKIEGCGPRSETYRPSGERAPYPGRTRRRGPLGTAERACLAAAVELYKARLASDEAALAYCEGRGIDRATLERHSVGYAGADLAEYLRRRGLPLQAARRVGLIRSDGRDFLQGRIVVPEIRAGQPIWLIGRVLSPESSEPRYLCLPGRRPLLGWESALHSPEVSIVEGVFDLLTLWKWHYPAIALVGTHVHPSALEALGRFRRIHLVLDSDPAGREASSTLQSALGKRARVVVLPTVKDVAELAPSPEGESVFKDALARSEQAGPEEATSVIGGGASRPEEEPEEDIW